MDFAEIVLSLVINLISDAIAGGVTLASRPYFERRKIQRRIEDATAEVVEPLLPFLAHEGVKEHYQLLLIETCVTELRPLANSPQTLFRGSLNGQKIFDELYTSNPLPTAILDAGLKDVYTLLFPRIATLLCRIPSAVKDWEAEAWTENFRRLDDLTIQLRSLFVRVDQMATEGIRDADETLSLARRTLAQKIGFELDLTGLRADRPLSGNFQDFFVHPRLRQLIDAPVAPTVDTPDDAFYSFTSRATRVALVGPPGAGKSTWTKWLQREAVTARWQGIAARIELRHLTTAALPSIQQVIRDTVGKHVAEELTPSKIRSWIARDLVLFIFDGFDEVRPTDRDQILDWIISLAGAARACPIIVTSRPLTTVHLQRLAQSWQTWSVEPFDSARIVEYIDRWYAHAPLLVEHDHRANGNVLARSWADDPTIGPLTGNPLLLSTLLMVHHLDGSLPSGRSQLYRRYVDGMLGLWDDRRQVSASAVQLAIESKRHVIRALALHLFLTERDQIDENELIPWLAGLLGELMLTASADGVLAALRERSGLILGPGVYSFAHKSIAEYLVAESVMHGDQRDQGGNRIDRFRLLAERTNDRWNTISFLWSGLAPIADVESFLRACTAAGAVDFSAGILYDQYTRFPRDLRRRLLLEILDDVMRRDDEFLYTPNRQSYWVVCGVRLDIEDKDRLCIPSFELRRLIPAADFSSLVMRASGDGTLMWSDIENLRGGVRDLLWMSFATEPSNAASWAECIVAECPARGSAERWLLWSVERSFAQALATQGAATDVMRILLTRRPEAGAFAALALLSGGLDRVFRSYDEVQDDAAHARVLWGIAEALQLTDVSSLSPKYLTQTSNWFVGYYRAEDLDSDLFSMYRDTVNQYLKKGTIQRDAVLDAGLAFVDRAAERRASLRQQ